LGYITKHFELYLRKIKTDIIIVLIQET
jgi:hypothetical protein